MNIGSPQLTIDSIAQVDDRALRVHFPHHARAFVTEDAGEQALAVEALDPGCLGVGLVGQGGLLDGQSGLLGQLGAQLLLIGHGFLGELAVRVSPDSVSPLVAYLAHEECSVNGHVYSVAGGRIARILVAETEGVVLAENTPEAIVAQLGVIDELTADGFHEPLSLDDETTIIAKALAEVS